MLFRSPLPRGELPLRVLLLDPGGATAQAGLLAQLEKAVDLLAVGGHGVGDLGRFGVIWARPSYPGGRPDDGRVGDPGYPQ